MSVFKAKELEGKEFNSKQEMFKALKADKQLLIDSKKSTLKFSDSIDNSTISKSNAIKSINVPENSVAAVINTTKYMDSHSDVHLNGIWQKSVADQQNKIYYVANHSIEVGSVIAYPKDVNISVKDVSWKDLGADFEGTTQALIFEVDKSAIKLREAKDIIEEKIDIQHSVRMQYVKIDLAIDDSSDEFKEEKAVWDKYINEIANKGKAIEQGYFWAVEEAKIYKEGSMVLAGSNDITPMLHSSEKIEPSQDTHKTEPPQGTHKFLLFY